MTFCFNSILMNQVETAIYPNITSSPFPFTDRTPSSFLIARYRAALKTTFPSLPYTTGSHVTARWPIGWEQLPGHVL